MNGEKQVNKLMSAYPVRTARLNTGPAQPRKLALMGRELVDRLLQHEVSRAEADCKKQLEEVRRQAYAEGVEHGKKETEERLLNQFQKASQILKKTAERYHEEMDALMQEQEQQMLRLILAVARKVVGLEVSTNPEIVLNVLRSTLKLANEKHVVRIVVSNADYATVRDNLKLIQQGFDLPRGVEILPTDSLEPGGVRLESEHGSVDAEIATQFEEIARRMLKDEPAIGD